MTPVAVAECPACGARTMVDPSKPMPACWRCRAGAPKGRTGCVRCERYGGEHAGEHVGSWNEVGQSPPPAPIDLRAQQTARLIEGKLTSLADVNWPVRTETARQNCQELAAVILRDMQEHVSLRCNAARRRLAELWGKDERQVSRTLPHVMAVPDLFTWMSKGHAWSKDWPNGKRAIIILPRR